MKVLYDQRFDIADIVLTSSELSNLTSEVVGEDIVLDFCGDQLVRIEVQRASKHLDSELLKSAKVFKGKVSV